MVLVKGTVIDVGTEFGYEAELTYNPIRESRHSLLNGRFVLAEMHLINQT